MNVANGEYSTRGVMSQLGDQEDMRSLTFQRNVVNTPLITFLLQHFIEADLNNIHNLKLGLLKEGGHPLHGPQSLGIIVPNISPVSKLSGQVWLVVQPNLLETEDVCLENINLCHNGCMSLE